MAKANNNGGGGPANASARPRTRRQRNRNTRVNLHRHHRMFGAMVIDPFKGPMIRGLSGDPSAPDTVLVRRRAIIPLSFSTLAGAGAEIAIVMNGRRNPYAAIWNGTAVTYVGRDSTDSGLVPSDAYARVVSSGVKILYTGSEHNRGGIWHHFSYDRDKSDAPSMAAFKTWGSLLDNLEYAVSDVRMPSNGVIGFVDSPEVGFGKVSAQGDALLDAGMPAADTDTSILRLAYTGPAESCKVELHVSEVIEYYHVDHAAFASSPVHAPNSTEVHQAVNSVLSVKGSQSSVADIGLAHRVGTAIGQAAGVVQEGLRTAGVVSGALKDARAFWSNYLSSSSVTIEELADDLPLLAL